MIGKIGSSFIKGMVAGGTSTYRDVSRVHSAFKSGTGRMGAIKGMYSNAGWSAIDASSSAYSSLVGKRFSAAAYNAGRVVHPAGAVWAGMGAVNMFRSGDNVGLF